MFDFEVIDRLSICNGHGNTRFVFFIANPASPNPSGFSIPTSVGFRAMPDLKRSRAFSHSRSISSFFAETIKTHVVKMPQSCNGCVLEFFSSNVPTTGAIYVVFMLSENCTPKSFAFFSAFGMNGNRPARHVHVFIPRLELHGMRSLRYCDLSETACF